MRSPSELSRERVLTEVLQSIRLRSALYCRARMTSRWGFKVDKRDHARFHYITGGQCWLEVEGIPDPVHLSCSCGFRLMQKRTSCGKTVAQARRCSAAAFGSRKARPIRSSRASLPFWWRDGIAAGVSLRSVFQLVDAEMAAAAAGSEALVSRMSDVIFLQAVRSSFAADCEQAPGLVRGLRDPAIGKSLVAMH